MLWSIGKARTKKPAKATANARSPRAAKHARRGLRTSWRKSSICVFGLGMPAHNAKGVTMSPIIDPRYAAAHRKAVEQERAQSEHEARMEYIKPAGMFVVGFAVKTISLLNSGDDEFSGAMLFAVYAVIFGITLLAGVAGLWVASKLWLGGAGSLGLCVLRLAGIYAMVDALSVFTSGIPRSEEHTPELQSRGL